MTEAITHQVTIPSEYIMPVNCLNNGGALTERINTVLDVASRVALAKVLRYLYLEEGVVVAGLSSVMNMYKPAILLAEPYLSAAEIIMVRYLATRTSGSERKNYGTLSVHRMRQARYSCEDCGSPDARTLVLDHTKGRKVVPIDLKVLCASCHQIKSRVHDWSGKARA